MDDFSDLSIDSTDATSGITSDSSSWLSDFGSSALQGLGLGSPSDAASTIGSILKPIVQPAAAQAVAAASGTASPKPASHTNQEVIAIVLALAVGAYLVLR